MFFTEKITDNLSLSFSSKNGIDFTAKIEQEVIPLLLTKKQIDLSIEKIKKLDLSKYSISYIKMIISGCFVTIMQRQ